MKKSKRYSILVELAKNKENAAVKALGQSNHIHVENIKKLESLKQFRLEYIEKFTQTGQLGMQVNNMQTYKNFIEGIERAIGEMKVAIIESEQQCNEAKKIWQHVHAKTEVMTTTVERFKKDELSDENRLEQKETDDRPAKQSKLEI